jgi:hypothetical protein
VQLPRIKELLLATENGEHNVALLEALMEYAGASQRKNDLFNQQNVITKKAAKIFELFSTDFKSAESVFTSHKPYLDETIRAINARSLNVTEFPYAEGDAKKAYHHRWIMVFIVGGATFEEAKLVHDLNAANLGQRILLGGSSMINSQQYVLLHCLHLFFTRMTHTFISQILGRARWHDSASTSGGFVVSGCAFLMIIYDYITSAFRIQSQCSAWSCWTIAQSSYLQ